MMLVWAADALPYLAGGVVQPVSHCACLSCTISLLLMQYFNLSTISVV